MIALALSRGSPARGHRAGSRWSRRSLPRGYAQRRGPPPVACATFTAGALVGGVITFGGLALLGAGAGGQRAPLRGRGDRADRRRGEAEARGSSRRSAARSRSPGAASCRVPLAAGLYGVLLGLGFTTFILTFAVWALAGISVALGDPAPGVAIGLAFGAGRALPVIALAPLRAPAGARTPRWPSVRAILRSCARSTRSRSPPPPPRSRPRPRRPRSASRPGTHRPERRRPAARPAHARRGRRARRPRAPRAAPGTHPAIGGGAARRTCSAGAIQVERRRRPGTSPLPRPAPTRVAMSTTLGRVARRDGAPPIYAAPLRDAVPRARSSRGPTSAARRWRATSCCSRRRRHGPRIEATDLNTGGAPRCVARRARSCATLALEGYRLTYVKATYQAPAGAHRPVLLQRAARLDRTLYGTTPTAAATPATSRDAAPRHGGHIKLLGRGPGRGVRTR